LDDFVVLVAVALSFASELAGFITFGGRRARSKTHDLMLGMPSIAELVNNRGKEQAQRQQSWHQPNMIAR